VESVRFSNTFFAKMDWLGRYGLETLKYLIKCLFIVDKMPKELMTKELSKNIDSVQMTVGRSETRFAHIIEIAKNPIDFLRKHQEGGTAKTVLVTLAVVAVAGALIVGGVKGCAGMKNDVADSGGFGAYLSGGSRGEYIIRNDSGGKIMDVWKLQDTFVKEDSGGAGYSFIVPGGEVVHIGGDVKIIRVNNPATDPLWNEYHDYHTEFSTETYQQLYGNPPQ
jgi:hypothetical protein